MIITIDGPAGTGKSTVAKRLAEKLGFIYFDTGAMFRSLAYGIITQNISIHNQETLHAFLNAAEVTLSRENHTIHFYLNGNDITTHIRRLDVTDMASKIATIAAVREKLAALQRTLAHDVHAVFEGRDMGTVVFPNAEIKVFLTAEPQVRAERRFKELAMKGEVTSYEKVLQEIYERDSRDQNREHAPLKAASDATIIDTSRSSIDEVIDTIYGLVLHRYSRST